jgi:hypothetical protein
MKNIALTLSLIYSSLMANAQVVGGSYNDLFDKFIMADYQDCLDDALKYTEKDKTRRESEPYLYASMVYMKYYNNPNYVEVDKDDLLKDALKYAAKFVKYETKNEESDLVTQNKEALLELKKISVELAEYFYIEENFRKATYFLKKFDKVKQNPEILLVIGNCQILARNVTEGERNLKLALEQLKTNNVEFTNSDLLGELTIRSFKAQIRFFQSNEETEKASQYIKMAAFYFAKDPAMANLYN